MNNYKKSVCILFCLPFAEGIVAAEWKVEPSVHIRQFYNDNIRLLPQEQDSVTGTQLEPSVKLSRNTETWDLSVKGRIQGLWYYDEDDLDTINSFLDVRSNYRSERGELSLGASQSNTTTLQNEYLDADTGLTINQIDRTANLVDLAFSYMLTEATWITPSVTFQTTEYEDGRRFGLRDYDTLTPAIKLTHQYTPLTQVYISLYSQRTDYSSDNIESTTDGINLGMNYTISEVWSIGAEVGTRKTQTSSTVITRVPRPGFEFFFPFIYDEAVINRDDETKALTYAASLTRTYETGMLQLSLTQSIMPSSTGSDTDVTRFNLSINKQLTPKLSTELAASLYQSSTVGGVTTATDYDRYRVAPSFTWKLSRDSALSAGYSYTRIDRDSSSSGSADSNFAYISYTYSWPPISMSR